MITINNKEITGVFLGEQPIAALYEGSLLIWELITRLSCYGYYWDDTYPWDDNSYWQDTD